MSTTTQRIIVVVGVLILLTLIAILVVLISPQAQPTIGQAAQTQTADAIMLTELAPTVNAFNTQFWQDFNSGTFMVTLTP